MPIYCVIDRCARFIRTCVYYTFSISRVRVVKFSTIIFFFFFTSHFLYLIQMLDNIRNSNLMLAWYSIVTYLNIGREKKLHRNKSLFRLIFKYIRGSWKKYRLFVVYIGFKRVLFPILWYSREENNRKWKRIICTLINIYS